MSKKKKPVTVPTEVKFFDCFSQIDPEIYKNPQSIKHRSIEEIEKFYDDVLVPSYNRAFENSTMNHQVMIQWFRKTLTDIVYFLVDKDKTQVLTTTERKIVSIVISDYSRRKTLLKSAKVLDFIEYCKLLMDFDQKHHQCNCDK